MKQEILFFLSCLGWALIIFILFTHGQSIAGANSGGHPGNDSLGTELRMFPMPIAIAAMPMDISFHGKSGTLAHAGASAGNGERALSPEAVSIGIGPLPGFNDHLARIQSYLLKYVTIGTDDTEQMMPAFSRERETDQTISLEFQAGLSDLSGALFFVMPI